jgi:hypothetical protein
MKRRRTYKKMKHNRRHITNGGRGEDACETAVSLKGGQKSNNKKNKKTKKRKFRGGTLFDNIFNNYTNPTSFNFNDFRNFNHSELMSKI